MNREGQAARADDFGRCAPTTRAGLVRDTLCNCAGHDCIGSVSDGLLAELFGVESVGACSPAREQASLSLYERLAARARMTGPEAGDLRALAPCPEVDSALGRLVGIIQGDYARHTAGIVLNPQAEACIREAVLRRLRGDAQLRAKAQHMRAIAALAETAMEHHYAQLLCEQLQRERVAFTRPPAGALRTRLLERCLAAFPYSRSYRLLALAELRLLQQPARPRLFRDVHTRTLQGFERERFERELSLLRSWDQAVPRKPLRTLRFAVCGAGPLPVSGLMLHTLTDAQVVLIERDPKAAAAARRLIKELERLRVLRDSAVEVAEADAAQLSFERSDCRCDVLLVASLVDAAGKAALARRLQAAASCSSVHHVLARSAGALCAELAYEPLDTLQWSELGLPFCGEQTPGAPPSPERHASTDHEQLVHSPPEVLNSTELFRPVQLTPAQRDALAWLSNLRAQLSVAPALHAPPESQVWITTPTLSCSS